MDPGKEKAVEYDILAVGFPLVEVMRKEKSITFTEPADFAGPYPSGDTCIVLDVAARLGKKCCLFGVVGDDPFGTVILERMKRDGIDVSYVRVTKEYNTAAVFVRYEKDGTREYMDFINHSACSTLQPSDIVETAVKNSKWIYFSGEVISNCKEGEGRKALEKLLTYIQKGTKVCLDPNFTLDISGMEEWFQPFIERADLILPSEGEAKVLMKADTDEEACRKLAERGKIVALKRGEKGCDIYSGKECIHVDAFLVKEIDPTGCGDSFGAGFLVGMSEGWSLEKSGIFANATGALQATAMGPMEGAKYYEEVESFILTNPRRNGGNTYGN